MAHNIEHNELTGTDSAVFVKEPAWHGLGTVVDGAMTSKEVIKLANLDYNVTKRAVQYEIGGSIRKFDDRFVICREDTKAALGVCGKTWTPLQNREAFNFFDALVDRSEAVYHTAGVLGSGERSWILAKLPSHIMVGKDDVIEEYALISNIFTGHDAIEIALTDVRVVCQNTLMMAIAGAKGKRRISIPHTKDVLKQVEKAHEALGMFNQYSLDIQSALQAMTKVKITDEILRNYLDELLPKSCDETSPITMSHKNREAIEEFFTDGIGQDTKTAKGTAFGLYQAVTGFTSHVKEYKTSTTKFRNLLIGGASYKLNQKAFDLAMALV